jgi:hypothetical protein
MGGLKNAAQDIIELLEAGLDLDMILDCTDYDKEFVVNVINFMGSGSDYPEVDSNDFQDVPF